ncbi:MAG: VCBS repeat-containing protein [Anaerolineales bacterium]|nr:VCBS repeat-containing protein [Anaerolineales bacterium]
MPISERVLFTTLRTCLPSLIARRGLWPSMLVTTLAALTLLFLSVLPVYGQAPVFDFVPNLNRMLQDKPDKLALGDMNGDGHLDIVTIVVDKVLNPQSGLEESIAGLAWYPNKGDAGIAEPVVISSTLTGKPLAMQIVDTNGDLRLDIVLPYNRIGQCGRQRLDI